jgi:hypothetical protein
MPVSMHQASVAVYVKLLNTLSATIDKAAAHAAQHKIEPSALIDARLFPDMWAFGRQVVAATSHAVRGTARLAGLPIPTLEEKTASFADLKNRIAQTITFITSVDKAAVDAGDTREITFPMGDQQRTMVGADYFLTFTLPNFYFHLTTAYDILRHNGVPISKTDFTGKI